METPTKVKVIGLTATFRFLSSVNDVMRCYVQDIVLTLTLLSVSLVWIHIPLSTRYKDEEVDEKSIEI